MKEELTGNQLRRKLGEMDGPRLLELLESYGYQEPFKLYRNRFVCISSKKIGDFSLLEEKLGSLSLVGREFPCFLKNGKIKVDIMRIRQNYIFFPTLFGLMDLLKKRLESIRKRTGSEEAHATNPLAEKIENELRRLALSDNEEQPVPEKCQVPQAIEDILKLLNLSGDDEQPAPEKCQASQALEEAKNIVMSEHHVLQFSNATESSRDGAFLRGKREREEKEEKEESLDGTEQVIPSRKRHKG